MGEWQRAARCCERRDGGDTWERRPIVGAERLDFRGIHAISADEAWALSIGNGPASRIFHTADGGGTWAEQFRNADSTAFFDCITFFDAKHGVAYSDASSIGMTILRTEDGGAHWALLPASAVPAALPKEGGFASSNSCAISVDSKHGFIAASTPGARVIFRTADAGATWTVAGLRRLSFMTASRASRHCRSAMPGTVSPSGGMLPAR